MKISVVTINLNNNRGLEKTLDSVLKQSYKEIEYIIIDGGSNDGSVDVIKRHQNRITYWCSEKDYGIYDAMNKGMVRITGEYVLFLNSGDYLYSENTIKKCVSEIAQNKGKIFYGDVVKYPSGKMYAGGVNVSLKYLKTENPPHQSTFYPKDSLFSLHGYDTTLKICGDWKLNLLLYLKGVEFMRFSRDSIIAYYDETGISNSNVRLASLERAKIWKEVNQKNISLVLKIKEGFKETNCFIKHKWKLFQRVLIYKG